MVSEAMNLPQNDTFPASCPLIVQIQMPVGPEEGTSFLDPWEYSWPVGETHLASDSLAH